MVQRKLKCFLCRVAELVMGNCDTEKLQVLVLLTEDDCSQRFG